MKRILPLFLIFFLSACNLPSSALDSMPEPASATETVPALATVSARPTPTAAPLGTDENPLVMTLIPSQTPSSTQVDAGKVFAEQLSEITGYSIVVASPESYSNLVQAMGQGNAHISVLSPYAYALVREKGFAEAAFASVKLGKKTYGAQFVARTGTSYKSYFDAGTGENTADAATALSQFSSKKPCWTDQSSLSGYVVPAGILGQNNIPTRSPAFLGGQPPVIEALYAGGICDFGATYIDARTFPLIKDKHPDVLEKVMVVWRIPPIIPYEIFALSRSMPSDMRETLKDAIFRASGMQVGRDQLIKAYGLEWWDPANDSFYDQFYLYVEASGVDLEGLVE